MSNTVQTLDFDTHVARSVFGRDITAEFNDCLDSLYNLSVKLKGDAFSLASYFRYVSGDVPNLLFTEMSDDELCALGERCLSSLVYDCRALSSAVDSLFNSVIPAGCD